MFSTIQRNELIPITILGNEQWTATSQRLIGNERNPLDIHNLSHLHFNNNNNNNSVYGGHDQLHENNTVVDNETDRQ
jgi:hypothetical protein